MTDAQFIVICFFALVLLLVAVFDGPRDKP